MQVFLFQVFASNSHKDDLITMLMAVDKRIQERNAEQLQTTETVNRGFNKRLYFNTGMRQCVHGCDRVGSDSDVSLHEKSCRRRKVPCVHEDCTNAVPLNGLIGHLTLP